MKQKIRKIVVDGETYIWRFAPGYGKVDGSDHNGYHDLFTAWLPGNRSALLRIHFFTTSNPYTGGPFRDSPTNLHQPKWAAIIIRYARQNGWNPSEMTKSLDIKNGVEFFNEMLMGLGH